MIIFWIFTLFAGASTFAFTHIFLQLGLAWSIADALVAMLLCRGLLSMVRRSLILGERLIAQGELMGNEISGLLDSVGMREPTAADPNPPELPMVPDQRAPIAAVSESA